MHCVTLRGAFFVYCFLEKIPLGKVAASEAEARIQVAQKEEGSVRRRDILAALRNADQYSDALIVVEDHEFPIHRAIVTRLSKFSRRLFTGIR